MSSYPSQKRLALRLLMLLIIAGCHFAATCFAFSYALALGLSTYNNPLRQSLFARVMSNMCKALTLPIMWVADESTELLCLLLPKSLTETMLFAANSLLWAACILLIMQTVANRHRARLR